MPVTQTSVRASKEKEVPSPSDTEIGATPEIPDVEIFETLSEGGKEVWHILTKLSLLKEEAHAFDQIIFPSNRPTGSQNDMIFEAAFCNTVDEFVWALPRPGEVHIQVNDSVLPNEAFSKHSAEILSSAWQEAEDERLSDVAFDVCKSRGGTTYLRYQLSTFSHKLSKKLLATCRAAKNGQEPLNDYHNGIDQLYKSIPNGVFDPSHMTCENPTVERWDSDTGTNEWRLWHETLADGAICGIPRLRQALVTQRARLQDRKDDAEFKRDPTLNESDGDLSRRQKLWLEKKEDFEKEWKEPNELPELEDPTRTAYLNKAAADPETDVQDSLQQYLAEKRKKYVSTMGSPYEFRLIEFKGKKDHTLHTMPVISCSSAKAISILGGTGLLVRQASLSVSKPIFGRVRSNMGCHDSRSLNRPPSDLSCT